MRRHYVMLAVVCSGWGTIPLVVRHVPVSPVAIAFARVAVAALALGLALALGADRGGRRVFSVQPARSAATGALLAVHWVGLFAAYRRAPAGTVILIVYMAPVAVAVLAPRVLGERHGSRTLVALGLAVLGFLLVARPAVHGTGRAGLALAVFTAVTFAALVIVSKPLAEVYGGLRLAFIEMSCAAVTLLPWAALSSWGPPRWSWGLLVVLGLVHTGLGVGLYLHALANLPATHVGIMGYLEPVGVVVLAWLFLGETASLGEIAGGALVLVAGAILIRAGASAEVTIGVGGRATSGQ